MVLKRVFGPKEYEMDRTCSTNLAGNGSMPGIVGKSEGKRPPRRSMLRRLDIIKMDLREVGCVEASGGIWEDGNDAFRFLKCFVVLQWLLKD
jgi:hypothetical protein